MAPPLTSGTITFFELLSLLYPLANEQDLATFKSWCYPEKPKEKIKYVLSAEQRAELKEMFRIVDKDRSGELTVEELMTMFSGSSITGETGVNEEELKVFFAEAKLGGSNSTARRHPIAPTPTPTSPKVTPSQHQPGRLRSLPLDQPGRVRAAYALDRALHARDTRKPRGGCGAGEERGGGSGGSKWYRLLRRLSETDGDLEQLRRVAIVLYSRLSESRVFRCSERK
jgi:hypothetical protein